MIQIKSDTEILAMRRAGLVVARTLAALREVVAPGVTTGDLNDLAVETIASQGAHPSFLGYGGPPPFPGVICASVNEEIVHGIPRASRRLREGDIIAIDCGAIVEGWHGDSAITVPVGEVAPELTDLLTVCEDSLWAGLAAVRVGNRLSDISHAVESAVRPHGYGIVEHYGGHGIGTEMHQDPHILNYGRPGRGPRLVKGMALAVEPMINLGSPDARELEDGWTVVAVDGSASAHFEHTVALTESGPWVLTAVDGGRERLGALGVSVPTEAS